ncbi:MULTISPECIES: oxygen-insensitive NADPH nitroreductase [Halomonadaceae]|uniref:NADPH-dependent oxidoreductase n=2 Tax=Halomonadaceae TaxID=28256 RepID=A0A8H9I605_9GAMM|nr:MULTISPECIES: oxygen-insensitive NADPH nitroreductase [Halomonas]ATH76195.1 oxygen-insensitive NADPH nitroreductase [Halomonas hydrothermalis]NGO89479.1 oxygen-insensitive NADPH nitroreductase [Halomonas sp.]KHJ52513.1 FMN reductase [Halomonas hydrothermalis]PJX13814.1 oxygen-insensitive NADPH nitroreductase [Halomonas sp. 141]UDM08290.1 oxygen-insensitive NADPH nitroreductase [Halomonas sp. NyZ770]
MNDVIKLLQSHRSIRKFTDQEIPRGLLLELIKAGQAAATSSHVQAYSVIHVKDAANREQLAELSGGQGYVASSAVFLVFCADMKRPTEASARTGANVERGMTEQLLVATVDTALMAQNVAVAAESEGLGICYIGGIRNNPEAVSELLKLPPHVYPVFGMCLGYPDHQPEVKPRLPVEAILKEDYYTEDSDQVVAFDDTMRAYYQSRSSGNKNSDWSHNLTPLFDNKLRPHMRDFLVKRGFTMK